MRSRLAHALALSVSGSSKDTVPFTVRLGGDSSLAIVPGGKVAVPVNVTRREGFKGNIQLTPVGVPPNVEAKAITIKGDANEGKLEFNFKKEVGGEIEKQEGREAGKLMDEMGKSDGGDDPTKFFASGANTSFIWRSRGSHSKRLTIWRLDGLLGLSRVNWPGRMRHIST